MSTVSGSRMSGTAGTRALLLAVLAAGLVSLVLCASMARAGNPPPVVPEDLRQSLDAWLKAHARLPEDYVVDKFRDHTVVLLGEGNRIKHDPELVGRLIPRLYKAGVRNLGIEFGAWEMQPAVDRLLNATRYDENEARNIMRADDPFWGYHEYLDIYRAAWKLNRSLPSGAPRFRVVNLGYLRVWRNVSLDEWKEDRRAAWRKANRNLDSDSHMAEVVGREFLDRGEKALIYTSMQHAFTRYVETGSGEGRGNGRTVERLGHRLRKRLGDDKVFCIATHFPWPEPAAGHGEPGRYGYPVRGIIDEVMRKRGPRPLGFDVTGSPFAELGDTRSRYAAGRDEFRLGAFCDGYVFQKSFRDYEGVTVDNGFITKANVSEVISNLAPDLRSRYSEPEDFVDVMRTSANFHKRYPLLK